MQSGRSLLKGYLYEDAVIIFGGNDSTLVEKVYKLEGKIIYINCLIKNILMD